MITQLITNMSQMYLQDYLRKGSIDLLKQKPYFLKIKYHQIYPNLVMFKYTQIGSDFKLPIVQEARGVILDSANNWEVVSFPYKKFFNYGESCASKINWPSAKVYQKLDGSLMVLYYYDGKWQVSSSGVPDASGAIGSNTFKELFWTTWNTYEQYKLPDDITKSFMFELMTPENQIIVKQQQYSLELHGVRCLKTLKEYDPEPIAKCYQWKCVRSLTFEKLDDVLSASKKLDPYCEEGYVVCDKFFNRIKIKNPDYVLLSHTKEHVITDLSILKVIQQNEGAEFCATFPEHRETYDRLYHKYGNLNKVITDKWNENLQFAGNAKEFANQIKDLWYKSCLFGLRCGKVKDTTTWLSNSEASELLQYL